MKRNFIFILLTFLLVTISIKGQEILTDNRGELGLKTFNENGGGYNDLIEADIHIIDEETGEHVYSGRYSYYYSHHFELERNKRYHVHMRLLNDLTFAPYQYFSEVEVVDAKIADIRFNTLSEEYVALAVTVKKESQRGEFGLKTFNENGGSYDDLVEADIHIIDEETGEHVYSGRYSYYYSHHFELERNKRYTVNMRLLNDLVFTPYQYFNEVHVLEDKIAVIHFDTFAEEYVALAVTIKKESQRGEFGLKTFNENGGSYDDLIEADIHIIDEETGEHVYSGCYSYYYSHHFELERNKRYTVNMRLLNDLVFTPYQYFNEVHVLEDKIAVIHFDTFTEEYVALAVTVKKEEQRSELALKFFDEDGNKYNNYMYAAIQIFDRDTNQKVEEDFFGFDYSVHFQLDKNKRYEAHILMADVQFSQRQLWEDIHIFNENGVTVSFDTYFSEYICIDLVVKNNMTNSTRNALSIDNETAIKDADDVESINVYNLSGVKMKTIDNPEQGVDLNNLEKGIYVIKTTMKNGTVKTEKVSVK